MNTFELWYCRRLLRVPWTGKIKLVHPKGNQSWIFIGRTDAEAEVPILWPPDEKNWLIGNDSNAGKDWRQEEKGTTEGEMVGWHHWLSGWVWTSFRRWCRVGKPGMLQSMGSRRVIHYWATEQQILSHMQQALASILSAKTSLDICFILLSLSTFLRPH